MNSKTSHLNAGVVTEDTSTESVAEGINDLYGADLFVLPASEASVETRQVG